MLKVGALIDSIDADPSEFIGQMKASMAAAESLVNVTAPKLPSFLKNGRTVTPKADPTRTKTLRARLVSQFNRRYSELKTSITRTIVEKDAFGLRLSNQIAPLPEGALAGLSQPEQVRKFGVWLDAAISAGVLEVSRGIPWTNPFFENAFSRGIIQGNSEIRAIQPSLGSVGRNEVFGVLGDPSVAESLLLEQNRQWTAFSNITVQMQGRVENILASGLEAGLSPTEIARQINGTVESIGAVRSRMIARTEIVRAHNLGSLSEHDRASIEIGEEVLSQWLATLDNRVRDNHLARHGKVFNTQEARRLLGEPNCRCGIVPFIASIEGKPDRGDVEKFLTKKDTPAVKATATKRRKDASLRDPKTGLLPGETRTRPIKVKPGEKRNLSVTEKKAIEKKVKPITAQQAATGPSKQNPKIKKQEKAEKLTPEEDASLSWYTGDGFLETNSRLRSHSELGDLAGAVDRLDTGIDKLKSEKGDFLRTVGFNSDKEARDFFGTFRQGGVNRFDEYLSTTGNKQPYGLLFNPADAPAGIKDNLNVLINIKGKNAKSVNSFSRNEAENEFLFARGTRFKVLETSETGYIKTITLEEL